MSCFRCITRSSVMLRISGWGQTGPGSARPGFGTLIEAASGFAAIEWGAGGRPYSAELPAGRHERRALRRQRDHVRALPPRRAPAAGK